MSIISVIIFQKGLRISKTTHPATKVTTVLVTANYEDNLLNWLRK